MWHATHPLSPLANDSLPVGVHFDTVVAGAGLTGLVTAVLLARAGQRTALVEARRVGAVTTGHTTGKLSLLQGLVFSDILRHHSEDVLQAYLDGNREGQAWLTRYLDDHQVGYERRDAYTYATTDRGLTALREEFDACEAAGLRVNWTEQTELPFSAGALTLPDQLQLHPLRVLDALREEYADRGGVLIEGVRVTDADPGSPLTVSTTGGQVTADRLVLATGAPVLDRGGYFAKLLPLRSYAATYRVPGSTIPLGMYLSANQPTRSLRTVTVDGEQWLMVGGNGHVTGREDSALDAVAGLDQWTEEHFPGAERVHAWSAQDYQSINRVPFVGELPRGGGQIFVATGFNKWGMTNAVAAALSLAQEILGSPGSLSGKPWAETLRKRVTKPAGVTSTAKLVGGAVVEATKGWVQAELTSLPDQPPAEGQGVVGRGAGGLPEAVSTVGGVTCRIPGACSHMGGVVRWNDAEQSWDCPLHGSRFAADGTVLEGPAVSDLSPRND
ncbi:FAD-dependent oxidoreductase [Granulicoccus sp. GXG6511]|uniref:FAD-dependent oxidoreductase n=1 Tax=Granulicoccus sp. GXG6511 TaxID=3381351 RepID=UPI003D7E1027